MYVANIIKKLNAFGSKNISENELLELFFEDKHNTIKFSNITDRRIEFNNCELNAISLTDSKVKRQFLVMRSQLYSMYVQQSTLNRMNIEYNKEIKFIAVRENNLGSLDIFKNKLERHIDMGHNEAHKIYMSNSITEQLILNYNQAAKTKVINHTIAEPKYGGFYTHFITDTHAVYNGIKYDVDHHDGYSYPIIKSKTLQGITHRTVFNPDNMQISYVIFNDIVSAHGYTTAIARSDFEYKLKNITESKEMLDKIRASGVITLDDYHTLTGACYQGMDQFKKEHNLNGDSMLLTELSTYLSPNDYGYTKIKKILPEFF